MMYLGDFVEDAEVVFYWNTNDSDGASITRATDGTVKVRRDDGTDCTGTSVTDNEDTPDTGIHECKIDTSDSANFAVAYDYTVWLDGAVIDGATVNAALAHFSVENRFVEVDVTKIGGAAQSATDLKDFADAGYDPSTHIAQSDLTHIHGSALTETAGQLAARFTTFFDQASAAFNVATALASFKATGFSTHSAADVVTALGTGSTLTACLTAAGFSTHDAAAVVTALGTGSTLTACLTAAGFSTHDAAAVVTALGTGSTLNACLTATGFNTVVPDVNGTAATLHTTTNSKIDTVDTVADAIQTVTDNLPNAGALSDLATLATRLSAARAGYLDNLNVAGTLANTDNASSFMADITTLALEATLTAMKGTGWTDESLKAIKDAVDAIGGDATLANQETLLDRLGGWTATGDNTILGALKAIASKAADTPSDIGGTFAASTDSQEAIRDKLTTTTITITNPINPDTNAATLYHASDYTALSVAGTLDFTFTDWAGETVAEAWFTVKRRYADADADKIHQETKTGGGITVSDITGLDLSVAVSATSLAAIDAGEYVYDVKLRVGDTVDVAVIGVLTVADVVTKEVP